MKASKHCGRTTKGGKAFGAKHNDRNFDFHKADHIDDSKVGENKTLKYYADEPTFEDCELRFYRENYSEQLEKVNQNYIESGHKERCKTIEDYLKSPKLCPEEEILQVGNMEIGSIDHKLFEKCCSEYLEELDKRFGSNMHILDVAIHYDEKTPHCHIRRVYDFTNADGVKEICQTQALKELGFEPPKPLKDGQKETRYNNRKMSFDKCTREIWYDILESHGIKLDREPVPSSKHKDKENYIRTKNENLIKRNQELEKRNQELETRITKTEEELEEQIQANEELKQMNEDLVQQVLDFKKEYEPILDLKRQLDLEITDKTVKLENLNNDFEKLDKRLKQIGVLEEHESTRDIDLKVLESRMKTPKKNIGIDR